MSDSSGYRTVADVWQDRVAVKSRISRRLALAADKALKHNPFTWGVPVRTWDRRMSINRRKPGVVRYWRAFTRKGEAA